LHKRQQIQNALVTHHWQFALPPPHTRCHDKHEIVGERLWKSAPVPETVEKYYGHDAENSVSVDCGAASSSDSDKPPKDWPRLLNILIRDHQLHENFLEAGHATFEGIWQAYHDLTVQTLYPWIECTCRVCPATR
jgi:hypothetical protein